MWIDVETIRAVSTAFQWTVLFLSVLILIVCLYAGHRHRRARPYLLVVITLAVHGIVFYIFALSDILFSPLGNLWSAALRFHDRLTILVVLIILLRNPFIINLLDTASAKQLLNQYQRLHENNEDE